MTIQALLRGMGIVAILLLVYGAYLVIDQWEVYPIGGFTIRHNRITDIVELKQGETWTRFRDDPYATPIDNDSLRFVRVRDITWGPGGFLVARAENIGKEAIAGRLAFRIVLRNIKDTKIVRDRAFRVNLELPPGQSVPFILDTDLTPPDATRVATRISVQPTSYSGQ